MATTYANYLKGNVNWTTNAVKLTVNKGMLTGAEIWAKVTCHENIADRALQFFATLYATGSPGSAEYRQSITASSGVAASGAAIYSRYNSALLSEATATYNDETQSFVQNGTAENVYMARSKSAHGDGTFAPVVLTFRVQRDVAGFTVFDATATVTIQPLPLDDTTPQLSAYSITAHRNERQIYGSVEVTCDEYLCPKYSNLYVNKGRANEIVIPVTDAIGEIVRDSGNNITGYKLTYSFDYEHPTEISYTDNDVIFEAFATPADHHEDYDILIDYKAGSVRCSAERKFRVQSINITQIESLGIGDTAQLSYKTNPTNAEIQTVTIISNDTSVATVDTYGRITAVSAGQASITVTSTDQYAITPSSTMTFYVRSDSFPIFANDYEYLSAQTTLDVVSALNELAGIMGVTLGSSMAMFDGSYTPLKSMQPLLDAINENVKQLCAAAGISHTLPASVPYRNINQTYYTMVNQWCRKIEAIHDSL